VKDLQRIIILGRVFNAFGATPLVSHLDMMDHPNLGFLAMALYLSRFPIDFFQVLSASFAEDVMTKKFKQIEHGPPLFVEPFATTIEELKYFQNNLPDPSTRGIHHLTYWWGKMRVKEFPMVVQGIGCCPGPLVGAGWLLGIKGLVTAIRKNPELAELAIVAANDLLKLRLDRAFPIGIEQFNEEGKGNEVYWCEGGGMYFSESEYMRVFDIGIGDTIRNTAKKGWRTYGTGLTGNSSPTMVKVLQCLQENGGGVNMGGIGSPVVDSNPMYAEYDKVIFNYSISSAVSLAGPKEIEEKIRGDFQHIKNDIKKTKGYRASVGVGTIDANAPLPNIDLIYKLHREMFKYPLE
jgi:hypothetical protein